MLSGTHYHCALALLVCGLWTAAPARATTTFIEDPGAGTGAERCLSGGAGNGGSCAAVGAYSGLTSMVQLFANSMGMTLTRVDDSADQAWIAVANSGAFGLARSASRDFTLGLIPGNSGNVAGYVNLLNPIGSSASPTEFLPSIPAGQNANGDLSTSATYVANGGSGPAFLPVFTPIPGADQNSNFRFAIKQVGGTDLWTSNPIDNRDATDHMVTWKLASPYLTNNNLVWYVVGFENAVFPGSDKDYNDYVFVFQNASPVTIPEPGSLLLVGAGGVALLFGRARRN